MTSARGLRGPRSEYRDGFLVQKVLRTPVLRVREEGYTRIYIDKANPMSGNSENYTPRLVAWTLRAVLS